jgi:hypothetical protein
MVRPTRKVLNVLLIFILGIATFAIAASPNMCLCGQACLHALCEKEEVRNERTCHERCHDPDCESCNVEKMVNLDAHLLFKKDDDKKSYYASSHIVVVSSEHLFDNHTIEHLNSVYSGGNSDPPPIYLRNLSLLF